MIARVLRFLSERIEPADDPRRIGKALQGDHAGTWRYRFGIRIIVLIEDGELVVLVLAIANRREVYR